MYTLLSDGIFLLLISRTFSVLQETEDNAELLGKIQGHPSYSWIKITSKTKFKTNFERNYFHGFVKLIYYKRDILIKILAIHSYLSWANREYVQNSVIVIILQ